MNTPKRTRICTPSPPEFGLPPLPSLENLVAIAAQISSLDEAPTATALRALSLFSECRTALIKARRAAATVRLEEFRNSEIREIDREFMESLEPCDDTQSSAVKLDSFLKACGCGFKPTTRISKWRSFARFYVEMREIVDGTPEQFRSHGSDLSDAGDEMATFYEVNGIGRDQVLSTRDLLAVWFGERRARQAKINAEKSKRAIAYLPVCRKAVNKGKLTDDDELVLKEMTDAEIASAIKTLRSKSELGENGAGMLIAALTDARLPKSAKPRVAKKIPKV